MDQLWCLYKQIKYQSKLIELRQDHFKFKMVSMLSQDYNSDAKMLQRANDDLCNQIYHLHFIVLSFKFEAKRIGKANRIRIFQWLLLKIILKFDKTNKT